MKLEYFDDAFEGRGLLLLYGGSPREVESLRAAVRQLLIAGGSIALHDLEFVEPVGDCQLTAASLPRGQGVRRSSGDAAFHWSLSPSEGDDTLAMLEPFSNAAAVQGGVYFQYLNPRAGPEFIYSTSRGW